MPQREYTIEELRAGKIPGIGKHGKAKGTKQRTQREIRCVAVDRLELVMPIVLVSEMNQHEHPMTQHKRKLEQQSEVRSMLAWVPRCPLPPPWDVTIVRLSSADRMDSDNEQTCGKWVRDEVARWLGCDDSKAAPVRWSVAWEESRQVGVRVVVAARGT